MPLRKDVRFRNAGVFSASGVPFLVDEPWAAPIRLEDGALALARKCRFGCNLRFEFEHYSVAQHSVLVSRLCNPKNAVIGLLHDFVEFPMGDMIRPLKRCIESQKYRNLEVRWQRAIGERFGVGSDLVHLPMDVSWADNVALATEDRDMYYGITEKEGLPDPIDEKIVPVGVREAYYMFMARAEELGLK